MPALAFIEVPFLSIAAVVADAAAKASGSRLLGFDTSGAEQVVVRLAGSVSELEAALEISRETAQRLAA